MIKIKQGQHFFGGHDIKRNLHCVTAAIILFTLILYTKTVFCADNSRIVTFSRKPGFYAEEFTLRLSNPQKLDIRYTTDSSEPTLNSRLYKKGITIRNLKGTPLLLFNSANTDKMYPPDCPYAFCPDRAATDRATVIRAAAFDRKGKRGKIFTATYFIEDRPNRDLKDSPVVSLVTDPKNLLDDKNGILVLGDTYEKWKNTKNAQRVIENKKWWHIQSNYYNKGKEWERPVSFELFDGKEHVSQDAGIRLKGGVSRMFSQKSFNIYFRKDYGKKDLDYPIFPDFKTSKKKTRTAYDSVSLRNGGNDAETLRFKDVLLQDMINARYRFDTQHSRCASVYINGEFYGYEFLCEKYSDRSVSVKFEISPDNVVIIKEAEIDEGEDRDIRLYENLLSFAKKDLSRKDNWEKFKKTVDIQSMADYFAVEIYLANADWRPDKNTELFRARKKENDEYADGRWRFMLYDTEYSSSMYGFDTTSASYDSYEKALEHFPVFRAAMKNEEFADMFSKSLKRTADRTFSPLRTRYYFFRYDRKYRNSVHRTYVRMGLCGNSEDSGYKQADMERYEKSIKQTVNFFRNRKKELRRMHPELF